MICYFIEFFKRFQGRSDLLKYAAEKGIPVVQTEAKPWSTDENMFHISFEAGILEDPSITPPADMWKLTKGLLEASSEGPEKIKLTFGNGVPTKLELLDDSKTVITDPLELFLKANDLGRKHGIGRIDIVENRFIGIKSRG